MHLGSSLLTEVGRQTLQTGDFFAEVGTSECTLAHRAGDTAGSFLGTFCGGPDIGGCFATGQLGQGVKRHVTLGLLQRRQEARIAGRGSVDQGLECGAVDVGCGLRCTHAFALPCLERVEHFRQVWAEGVAGNVSSFVLGNLAQVGQLAHTLGDQRASHTATSFKGCTLKHVAHRFNDLGRTLTRGFHAHRHIGQFDTFLGNTVAQTSTTYGASSGPDRTTTQQTSASTQQTATDCTTSLKKRGDKGTRSLIDALTRAQFLTSTGHTLGRSRAGAQRLRQLGCCWRCRRQHAKLLTNCVLRCRIGFRKVWVLCRELVKDRLLCGFVGVDVIRIGKD